MNLSSLRIFARVSMVFAILSPFLFFVSPVRAQSVSETFQSPPNSAKPQTWWHWVSGNVTADGITADLEAMKEIGLGGAQIFSVDQGPHGPVRYMSPEWRALVQHAIADAKSRGLKLSITDCEGWSESGGPWITPDISMQKVVWSTATAVGGQSGTVTLPTPESFQGYYRDTVVLAFPSVSDSARITNIAAKAGFNSDEHGVTASDPAIAPEDVIDPNKIINLTSDLQSDGSLSWTPPAGNWTILRMGMTSTGTPIHPAMPETVGLECDKFSQAAVTANWNGDLKYVIADSGANAGATLKTVLMDSWEAGTGNWTPLMPKEFQTRRGYDLTDWMPAFTGRVVGSVDQTERFLWDFRRTMADLVAENHYGLIRSLAHQHNMLLQAEAPGIGMPTVADALQCKGNTDVPMGEFWINNEGTLTDDKEAASAAHIYGRTLVAAESFTSSPENASWTNDPYSLKAEGDLAFCIGVNRYCFHRYAMQPYLDRAPGMTMGPWGLNFDRTNTWWKPGKAWISYITRCQYLLQQGQFVGDICYFYGEGAPQDVGGFHFSPAPPAGYDYDVCNADIILHQMSVKNGRIQLADGESYRVLVLPDSSQITAQIAEKVRDLVAAGATVVGPKPVSSPSLSDYPASDTKIAAIAQDVWGNCDGQTMTRHAYGKGTVVWGEPLEKVLSSTGPDFTCSADSGNVDVHYIHRRTDNADYYFVANHAYHPLEAVCSFRVSNKVPEFWWPDTGKIEPVVVYKSTGSRFVIPIRLDSAGSVFVVFRQPKGSSTLHIATLNAAPIPQTTDEKQHEVRIISAEYGVFTSADVTKTISDWYTAGEPALSVGNVLDGGADPDLMIAKHLSIDYTVNGTSHSTVIDENNPVTLPDAPAGTPNVVITKALYGGPGVAVDVKRQVETLIENGVGSINASTSLNDGIDPDPNIVKALQISYEVDGVTHTKTVSENSQLYLFAPPADPLPVYNTEVSSSGQPELAVWQNDTFHSTTLTGASKAIAVTDVPAPIQITGGWDVSFSKRWGGPASYHFDHLQAWNSVSNDGVKYYSGTADYTKTFSLSKSELGPNRKYYLDLGMVKNLADVTLNGVELGILWKEPFRIEITNAAKVGVNSLSIKVTNLWPNRLIGDSGLSQDQRYTWTTFNPYHPTSDLLDSGILGPVTVRTVVLKPISN